MLAFLQNYYNWILSFHIIAILFWMAGLYYLPRLFVYHVPKRAAPDIHEIFLTMEHKLLRIIMLPALLAAWGFGLLLVVHHIALKETIAIWLITKLSLVLGLSAYHGFLARTHKRLAAKRPVPSARAWRFLNEIPPLLTIIIVLLVILKP